MGKSDYDSIDQRFMTEALELAELGRGHVEPNPMVGAIIVRDGQELARGWHRIFGGPHAEIQALRAADQAGRDVRGATMYVTLEPCCHHGKTPPCSDAILFAGIGRVVTAMVDPAENVAGNGIRQLTDAGLEVDVGICESEAKRLLAPYRKLRTSGRPWVICKWAQTSDGLLALPSPAGQWISCEESRQYVHQVRSHVDAILVGIGTVLADDPLLTNRSGKGKQPARIVLDSRLSMPIECCLANTPAVSEVIVVTAAGALAADTDKAEELHRKGVDLLEMPTGEDGRICLPALLDALGRREWTYLLVEGGAETLASFVGEALADELLVFVSPDIGPAGAEGLPRFDIADVRHKLIVLEETQAESGRDKMLRYVLND